jgi:replicative DNA helicase
MEKIETTILRNLLFNNDYCRKVLPFIKNEYFENLHEKVVFEEICKFIIAYDGLATKEVLLIETEKRTDITEDTYKTICDYVSNLDNSPADTNWVTDTTEKWCRDRAIYLALMESIKIADGQDDKKNRDAIPTILQEALAISFDDHIGHDYLNDYENRFDSYHRKEDKIAFDLDYFNKITKGGIPNKTLNIALAGCVHPETKVKIRFRKISLWIEKETTIAEIKTLLDNGYEVEVDSPDGYVPVNFFINKGMYEEYELHLYDTTTKVKCNESHLFETNQGWISAKSLEYSNSYWEFITKDGLRIGKVIKTNNQIPIVDINVNHPNHRYYTNGVSSHNTGVGKSLFMCHFAASVLLQGKNVLYITLEMAEEKIAERIDANLLNVNIKDIETLPKMMFDTKINSIAKKTQGTLIIKEYPTASAHAGHFRALLNELSLKKSFRPDIIFIDYLNICGSSRYKSNFSVNSYSYIKAIAEELRGLAVEANVPIVSATQTTRSGFSSSDPDLTDTSESFGLPATADLMFALISTEELEQLGQIMVKQLKNRYNDPTMNKRFVVGIDRAKMRLFDVEQSAQNDILDSGQEEEYTYEEDKPKKQFSGFKF